MPLELLTSPTSGSDRGCVSDHSSVSDSGLMSPGSSKMVFFNLNLVKALGDQKVNDFLGAEGREIDLLKLSSLLVVEEEIWVVALHIVHGERATAASKGERNGENCTFTK